MHIKKHIKKNFWWDIRGGTYAYAMKMVVLLKDTIADVIFSKVSFAGYFYFPVAPAIFIHSTCR